MRKLHPESENATLSGGEDDISHDSGCAAEPGPSRGRRASDDSGAEAPAPQRSEIELIFCPHPLLVSSQQYSQTR